MKLFKCDCINAVFPFGSGAPICIRLMEKTGKREDLRQCKKNGCKHYVPKNNTEKEEPK
jgi:hypothetical protein